MVDWKKLYDEWDKVPDELKDKIRAAYREKSKEKLDELFKKEPDALKLYERIIGKWVPIPPLPPVAPPAFPKIPEEGITEEWLEDVKAFNPGVKPQVDVAPDYTYRILLMKYIDELKDNVPMAIIEGIKTPPEADDILSKGEDEGWKWKPEDVTPSDEFLEAHRIWDTTYSREDLEALTREGLNKVARIKGFSAAGKKGDVIDRIVGAPPVVPPPAAPPLISEPSTWEEFETIFDDLYAKDFRVNTKLTGESAEESIRVSEEQFGRFKEWQPVKIPPGSPTPRFGYMDGSQGLWVAFHKTPIEAPPPVAPPTPPLVAPPERPPVRPPVKPPPARPPLVPKVGLTKDDEGPLSDLFLSRLMEGTLTPGTARGHLPEFRSLLASLKIDLAKEEHDKAVELARSEVAKLASDIIARRPPVVRPPVPVVPPEEVPPVVFPAIVPVAPPSGLARRWGMPFSFHLCPACVGRGEKTLEECTILRSPYLDDRLRRLGLPTPDPLFFELCDEDRLKYGGAFEHFPRNKTEFWVGEVLAKADIDIATLVGVGITEEYCHYALGFYEENKHLAVQ